MIAHKTGYKIDILIQFSSTNMRTSITLKFKPAEIHKNANPI